MEERQYSHKQYHQWKISKVVVHHTYLLKMTSISTYYYPVNTVLSRPITTATEEKVSNFFSSVWLKFTVKLKEAPKEPAPFSLVAEEDMDLDTDHTT